MLDGLRALSVSWVVAFHVFFFAYGVFDARGVAFLVQNHVGHILFRGELGVDVFFVLSGYLIAGSLFEEAERSGRFSVRRFYVRRAMRLFPAYALAMGLHVALLSDVTSFGPPRNLWANALYVNNFLPVVDMPMVWTWSLAIEEQFYLVFPWIALVLVRHAPARRTAALAILVAVFVVIPTAIAIRHGLGHKDVDLALDGDLARWIRAFDLVYDKPYTRAGALLAGVLAVHLRRTTDVVGALGRHRLIAWLLVVVAALAIGWALFPLTPRPFVDRLHVGASRTLFALAVGYFILLAQSTHVVGRAVDWVLSSRALYPVGQLAYSAYLLNPIVVFWLTRRGPPPPTTFLHFVVYALVTAGGTFVAAAFVYLFVERPVMALRPRAEHQSPIDEGDRRR